MGSAAARCTFCLNNKAKLYIPKELTAPIVAGWKMDGCYSSKILIDEQNPFQSSFKVPGVSCIL